MPYKYFKGIWKIIPLILGLISDYLQVFVQCWLPKLHHTLVMNLLNNPCYIQTYLFSNHQMAGHFHKNIHLYVQLQKTKIQDYCKIDHNALGNCYQVHASEDQESLLHYPCSNWKQCLNTRNLVKAGFLRFKNHYLWIGGKILNNLVIKISAFIILPNWPIADVEKLSKKIALRNMTFHVI